VNEAEDRWTDPKASETLPQLVRAAAVAYGDDTAVVLRNEDEPEDADVLPGPGSKKRTQSDQIASLEQEFRHALGCKVEIRANAKGKGKLTIHFQNHEEFDRLRTQLTDALNNAASLKVA
jgi:ParB family chromosome partitioning protein